MSCHYFRVQFSLPFMDRQLEIALRNCKFLEQKMLPLSEDNAQLKQSIHALIYYMEERRNDFASLLQQFDIFGEYQDRRMIIQIGDLITIYECLKEDLNKMKRTIGEQCEQIELLQSQISNEQQLALKEQEALKDRIIELVNQSELKELQISELHSKIKEFEKASQHIAEAWEERLLKLEKVHVEQISELKQNHDKVIEQIRLNDDDYDRKLNQVKLEYQLQRDKFEVQHQQELKAQQKETQDTILKQDQKIRQLMTELQNIKSELALAQQESLQHQKQIQKHQKQSENLSQIISKLREEVSKQKQLKIEQIKIVEKYKQELELATRTSSEFQHKYQKAKDRILEIEQSNLQHASLREQHVKQLQDTLGDRERQLLQMQNMLLSQKQEFSKQFQIQRVKYEKVINNGVKAYELDETYKQVDEEVQFESPEFKRLIDDYELRLADQTAQIGKLTEQVSNFNQKLAKELASQKKLSDQMLENTKVWAIQAIQKGEQAFKSKIEEMLQIQHQEIRDIQEKYEKQLHEQDELAQRQLQQFSQQIDHLEAGVKDKETTINYTNELVMRLQIENYNQQKAFDEKLKTTIQQLQMEKMQLEDQFQQETQAQEEKFEKLQNETEDILRNKANDNKIIADLRKKLESSTIQVRMAEEEYRLLEQELRSRDEALDAQSHQLQRLNDLVRYLQAELENTKHIYNIFKNTNHATHSLTYEVPLKSEFKRMLVQRMREQQQTLGTTSGLKRPQLRRKQDGKSVDSRVLPKVRSISGQKIYVEHMKTSPHYSSQHDL